MLKVSCDKKIGVMKLDCVEKLWVDFDICFSALSKFVTDIEIKNLSEM